MLYKYAEKWYRKNEVSPGDTVVQGIVKIFFYVINFFSFYSETP